MPIPTIMSLYSFAFGSFGFGNSLYNLLAAKTDPFPGLEKKLQGILDDLSATKAQLADLEVDLSLASHVDHVLGYFDSYRNTVIPAVSAYRGDGELSEQGALDKLTEIFNASNLVRSWCNDVHNAGIGVSAQLRGIHNQMMGSEVHGRPVIDAAFSRALYNSFGVDSLSKLSPKLPPETTRPKATKLLQQMDSFMAYVLNVQRLGLGCLLSASLIDPEFRRLEELIKAQKRDFYRNVLAQYEDARERSRLFGTLDRTILMEIGRDCNIP